MHRKGGQLRPRDIIPVALRASLPALRADSWSADVSAIVEPYAADPEVQRMREFVQHGTTSTYDHCLHVARTSYAAARLLRLDVDVHDLVVGAFLHDLFLYDWHDRSTARPHHATMHPAYACQNASRLFGVSPKVEDIILSHMWPLVPHRVPRSREALVVSLADKFCAMCETLGF